MGLVAPAWPLWLPAADPPRCSTRLRQHHSWPYWSRLRKAETKLKIALHTRLAAVFGNGTIMPLSEHELKTDGSRPYSARPEANRATTDGEG